MSDLSQLVDPNGNIRVIMFYPAASTTTTNPDDPAASPPPPPPNTYDCHICPEKFRVLWRIEKHYLVKHGCVVIICNNGGRDGKGGAPKITRPPPLTNNNGKSGGEGTAGKRLGRPKKKTKSTKDKSQANPANVTSCSANSAADPANETTLGNNSTANSDPNTLGGDEDSNPILYAADLTALDMATSATEEAGAAAMEVNELEGKFQPPETSTVKPPALLVPEATITTATIGISTTASATAAVSTVAASTSTSTNTNEGKKNRKRPAAARRRRRNTSYIVVCPKKARKVKKKPTTTADAESAPTLPPPPQPPLSLESMKSEGCRLRSFNLGGAAAAAVAAVGGQSGQFSSSARSATATAPPATVWPLSFIKAEDCAKAGLFYLGFMDRVQCAYCLGVLGQWEAGDDPAAEHQRIFPHCKFVQNLLRVRASAAAATQVQVQVPIEPNENEQPPRPRPPENDENLQNLDEEELDLSMLLIPPTTTATTATATSATANDDDDDDDVRTVFAGLSTMDLDDFFRNELFNCELPAEAEQPLAPLDALDQVQAVQGNANAANNSDLEHGHGLSWDEMLGQLLSDVDCTEFFMASEDSEGDKENTVPAELNSALKDPFGRGSSSSRIETSRQPKAKSKEEDEFQQTPTTPNSKKDELTTTTMDVCNNENNNSQLVAVCESGLPWSTAAGGGADIVDILGIVDIQDFSLNVEGGFSMPIMNMLPNEERLDKRRLDMTDSLLESEGAENGPPTKRQRLDNLDYSEGQQHGGGGTNLTSGIAATVPTSLITTTIETGAAAGADITRAATINKLEGDEDSPSAASGTDSTGAVLELEETRNL